MAKLWSATLPVQTASGSTASAPKSGGYSRETSSRSHTSAIVWRMAQITGRPSHGGSLPATCSLRTAGLCLSVETEKNRSQRSPLVKPIRSVVNPAGPARLAQAVRTPRGVVVAPADAMAQEQRHVDARLALAVDVHADAGVAKPGPASAKPHVRERACTLVLEKNGFVTGNELAFLADRGEELHRKGPGCSGRPVAFRSTRRCFASGSGGSADEEYVTDRRRQSPARADDHQQRVRRMFGLFDEMRCRSMRKHSREATESTPDGAWLPPISTCTVRVDKTQREDLTGAWFNFRISEGDGSWVAGVKLATASDPPVVQSSDLRASPFGR